MDTPLIATKLYPPPPRANRVPRPRLMARLNDGLRADCRLVLITAPAGFGKTSLLSEWISDFGLSILDFGLNKAAAPSIQNQVAWVALDENDNDPVRFWTYVFTALQKLYPQIGDNAAAQLHTPHPPPLEVILTAFINTLAKPNATAAIPALLILDDYHEITTPAIHAAVAFLLDHLPPTLHLLIATRAEPPLPVARLRARQQLLELQAADLRFTAEEASIFLNQVMGLGLTAAEISALEDRTEGWITGLQLAALSMQGRTDIPGFIAAFSGSSHYILDYLMEEVLHRQPPDVQDFLLHTSILNRLTGPLCAAVLSLPNSSQAVLEQLEHANLFIVPLDNERRWYRYHHLFAEFLRARLRQASSEQVATLHGRAAAWYAQNDLTAEAVEHALAAEDHEQAARLVQQLAVFALMRGEISTLLSWLQKLPPPVVHARPRLGLYYAWALLASMQWEAIEPRLDDVEQGMRPNAHADPTDEEKSLCAELDALRAFVATFNNDIPRATALSREALDHLPDVDELVRGVVALNLGFAQFSSGNLPAAYQAFAEAARASLKIDNKLVAVFAICHQGDLLMIQGRMRQAEEIYRQARQLATDSDGQLQPLAGLACQGAGEILRERNQLAEAVNLLETGIQLSLQWNGFSALEGYVMLTRAKYAQGDLAGAQALIRQAVQLAEQFDIMEINTFQVLTCQARLQLAQGDLETVAQWARTYKLIPDSPQTDTPKHVVNLFLMEDMARTNLARFFMARGQLAEALAILQTTLQAAENGGRMRTVIEALALQALALHAQGKTTQVQLALSRALELAEPEGYLRIFVDEGPAMQHLLSDYRRRLDQQAPNEPPDKRRSPVTYVAKLLNAFPDSGLEAHQAPNQNLIEPLSTREIEILRLIAAGLTNQAIAQKLVIEVSTVKRHINNLYGKLGAHSRTQALARARELQLL